MDAALVEAAVAVGATKVAGAVTALAEAEDRSGPSVTGAQPIGCGRNHSARTAPPPAEPMEQEPLSGQPSRRWAVAAVLGALVTLVGSHMPPRAQAAAVGGQSRLPQRTSPTMARWKQQVGVFFPR